MSADAYGGSELRCAVCEGVDQPGLRHNPESPYCIENDRPLTLGYIDPSDDEPPRYSLRELVERGF